MLPWLPDFDVLTDIIIACLSVMFAQPLSASLCCILLTSTTCYHTIRCVWVVCGGEWRTRTPTGEGDSEGLPPTCPSVSSELSLYFDTIGNRTAKERGRGWGKVGGLVRGGMEGQRWRCRSGRTKCGGMVAQRVVPQPRKEKKKKKQQQEARTPQTLLTTEPRHNRERGKMTKNDNKDQGTGLMPST